MMPPLPIIAAFALAVALWYVGEETVQGAKWLGHEGKVGAAKVVHVLKKIHL